MLEGGIKKAQAQGIITEKENSLTVDKRELMTIIF